MYAIAGIATGTAGVLVLAILIFVALILLFGRKCSVLDLPRINPVVPVLYVFIGLALGYNLFISRIGSLDVLFQAYDVTWHLNVIQGFVDSGELTCVLVSALIPVSQMRRFPLSSIPVSIQPLGTCCARWLPWRRALRFPRSSMCPCSLSGGHFSTFRPCTFG